MPTPDASPPTVASGAQSAARSLLLSVQMPPVSPSIARHVQDITSGVLTLARSRQGRIAAITVLADPAFIADSGPGLKAALADRLAGMGNQAVEVLLRAGDGPPRLLSIEYAR